MYKVAAIKDSIKIPPRLFSESLEKSAKETLMQQYEGKVYKNLGVVIAISGIRDISVGKIIPGSAGSYHKVTFEALIFKPELHEVIRGKVSEITQFGAFIKFGPIDGLVHKSQVTDDFMSYNEKTGTLVGKQTKRVLKKDDEVLARIIAISLKENVKESKINLTMRREGLGKKDWYASKKKAKKTTKEKKK